MRGFGLLARFGLVGAATTLVDLGFFNLLSGQWVGLSLVPAHLMASVVTLTASFLGQRNLVFAGHDGQLSSQAVRFVLVTVVGVALVQSAVLTGMAAVLAHAQSQWGLLASMPPEHWPVTQRNESKAAAMVVGIAWNFFWFRHWVFRSRRRD
jgi:putative flippase GtrA